MLLFYLDNHSNRNVFLIGFSGCTFILFKIHQFVPHPAKINSFIHTFIFPCTNGLPDVWFDAHS